MPSAAFPRERLERISALENSHFWFLARREVIERRVARCAPAGGQRILEIGCGTGALVERLAHRGQVAVGLDLRAEGMTAMRRRTPALQFVRGEAERLPFASRTFDGILLLDVLEHVDDGPVLDEVSRVLGPNGWVLITAPAIPWIWSYRDRAAGHLRRYSARSLRRTVEAASLQVEDLRPYQFALLPIVLITRLLGRRGPRLRDLEERPPATLNGLLARINKAEARLGESIRLPWGTSWVALCRKPGL